MIQLRVMTVADLPLGMRLKSQARWNQTEADWRRVLELQPDGCFVAELDGQGVGTTCVSVFGEIGWISMVLVEESVRGHGVGKRAMEHALEYLDRTGVPTARLDATPLGRPLYERLGFVVEYELARWTGVAQGEELHPNIRLLNDLPIEMVVSLDRDATGTDRRRLLERLYQERPDAMHVFLDCGQLIGYRWLRRGSQFTQIGPAVAREASAGCALLDAAMVSCQGQPVAIDLPVDNQAAVAWAQARGLTIQRQLTRMSRGRSVHDRPEQLWGSFGPEKG